MINKIKTRLASEEGFTLIELLVVIIILGILVAIAVPAYLSFRGSAQDAAAKSNVRSAVPAAEEYYQEDTVSSGSTYYKGSASTTAPDTYTGITLAALQVLAPGVASGVTAVSINSGNGYCVDDSEDNGGKTAYYIGGDPGGALTSSANPVVGTVTAGATCSGVVTADS